MILAKGIRIASHVEPFTIVAKKHPTKGMGRRLVAEMAAHVSKAEAAARVWMICVWTDRRSESLRMLLVPPGAFGLVFRGCGRGVEVEGKYQIAVYTVIAWLDRERAPAAGNYLLDLTLGQQYGATVIQRFGIIRFDRDGLVVASDRLVITIETE